MSGKNRGPRHLQSRLPRAIGFLLNLLGALLLLGGGVVGWAVPRLPGAWLPALVQPLAAPLRGASADASAYLGADITALAVLIAVVIGFNVTVLQIAGQVHSLRFVRGILSTLTPFLICWSVTTAIALLYFLIPLTYVGQLWQLLAWFAAVVLLMLAYLWDLPWRLSGEYVIRWAVRGIRGLPVAEWEENERYSAIQNAMVAAGGRGDIGTARAIAQRLGRFLAELRDAPAESADTYNRRRYRALKTLLSGCAQALTNAPTAMAYYLGYLQAGVLLQATAGGHPADDAAHDLYTGLLAATQGRHETLNALWTGLRHALCRPNDGGPAYLLDYWLDHSRWTADDPRRVERIAVALGRFHAGCLAQMQRAAGVDLAADASELAADLYRDIAEYLGPAVQAERRRLEGVRPGDLPVALLDATHTAILRAWPEAPAASAAARVAIINAYEARRAQLIGAPAPVAATRP